MPTDDTRPTLREVVLEMFTDPITGKPSSGAYITNEIVDRLRTALAAPPTDDTRSDPLREAREELAFVADWAHDCSPSNSAAPTSAPPWERFGFDDIEERCRALLPALDRALASGAVTLDVDVVAEALHEMEGPGRHSRPRLTRQICPGPGHHRDEAVEFVRALARLSGATDRPTGLREAAKAVVAEWDQTLAEGGLVTIALGEPIDHLRAALSEPET